MAKTIAAAKAVVETIVSAAPRPLVFTPAVREDLRVFAVECGNAAAALVLGTVDAQRIMAAGSLDETQALFVAAETAKRARIRDVYTANGYSVCKTPDCPKFTSPGFTMCRDHGVGEKPQR